METRTVYQDQVEAKSFKSSKEITEFYQFVYENGLREEARLLLEKVLDISKPKKKRRKKSKKIH